MRGRPRTFDENETLDRVVEAFRRGGYERTNLSDLVASSGLSSSSLYNAFGNKEALFEKALRRYVDGDLGNFFESLTAEPANGVDPLHDFIDTWAEPFDPGKHTTCLVGRLLLDNAVSERTVRQPRTIRRTLKCYWDGFTRLVAGRRSRVAELDDREVAAVLVAAMLGVIVLARNGHQRSLVEAISSGSKKIAGV